MSSAGTDVSTMSSLGGTAPGRGRGSSRLPQKVARPPGFSAQVFQTLLAEPLLPDANGDILVPKGPGLGVEPNPELLRAG